MTQTPPPLVPAADPEVPGEPTAPPLIPGPVAAPPPLQPTLTAPVPSSVSDQRSPMNLGRYSKAIGGIIGIVIALGGALLSLGVLSGSVSHNLAVVLAALTPIAGGLGIVVAPANAPTAQAAEQSAADLVKAAAAEWRAICDAVGGAPAAPTGAVTAAPAEGAHP